MKELTLHKFNKQNPVESKKQQKNFIFSPMRKLPFNAKGFLNMNTSYIFNYYNVLL